MYNSNDKEKFINFKLYKHVYFHCNKQYFWKIEFHLTELRSIKFIFHTLQSI